MKAQKTLRVVAMLVAGVMLFSFCLIGNVSGDDQGQDQDRLRIRLHGEDCDCICTCCEDCPCSCCENCPCPCCQDDLVEEVFSGDQDQDHDHEDDPHHDQDPDQDRDRLGWEDLTEEELAAMLSQGCDCLCQCCQDCLCTCCKNCLCPCCQTDFCTTREIRALIRADETFRALVQNQFRIQNTYLYRKGGGGGHDTEGGDEGFGNCLSYPVIFVDHEDGSVILRGTYDSPVFGGAYEPQYTCGHEPDNPEHDEDLCPYIAWYLQKEELNAWQAGSHKWGQGPEGDEDLVVSGIAWGDNLLQAWTTHSVVRVETVLNYDTGEDEMTEFTMGWISGLGIDEMWGTNTETFDSSNPTVYTPNAKLKIQRWNDDVSELTWDEGTKEWIGAGEPVVEGGYSAEINVKGKIIFGYNWFLRDYSDGPGLYRITMFLEEDSKAVLSPQGYIYKDVLINDAADVGGGGGGGGGGSTLEADFEAIPTNIESGETVYFTDTSSGNPKSWLWEFGDGSIARERNPRHTYYWFGDEDKTFDVRLTIMKGIKEDNQVKVDYITVSPQQPSL